MAYRPQFSRKMDKGYLTNKKLWKKSIKDFKFPIGLNSDLRDHRAFINILENYIPKEAKDSNTVLEIGCNPGRFLSYLSSNMGYKPYGIDFDKEGCFITRQNLLYQNLEGEIIESDIFEYNFNKAFSLVISCGFIEHFEGRKLQTLLAIHNKLVEKNGLLFMTFPNFRYLNYFFAYFFRRRILETHNTNIMNKKFFIEFANKYGFEITYLNYFGGIHPGGLNFISPIYKTIKNNNNSNSIVIKCMKWLILKFESLRLFDNINSRFFSHHLGAVLRKK